jgi:hypothetical protein
MTHLVGHVVRMTGGQCAPDDMGWWLGVQGMGQAEFRTGHLTRRAWPNLTIALARVEDGIESRKEEDSNGRAASAVLVPAQSARRRSIHQGVATKFQLRMALTQRLQT